MWFIFKYNNIISSKKIGKVKKISPSTWINYIIILYIIKIIFHTKYIELKRNINIIVS